MKKIHFVADVLPHLIAILAFLLITLIFFNPAFFDNKTLQQADILEWEGSSKALRDYRQQTGEEGLWTPAMFSGMPAYLVNVEWSNGPVLFFKKIMSLGLAHPYGNIFLAFVSYYILLLAFRIRPYLAIAGAVAFGLSSFIIIGLSAGHNARIGAMAFMPLVMAGIHLVFSGKRLLGFGVAALGMALHLRENHLQVTYYLMIVVAIYGIVQLIDFIRDKKINDFLKSIGILFIAVLLGAATFFGPFWAITEYTAYSTRGTSELKKQDQENVKSGLSKEYAFEFSNGIWEPLTLIVPNIYGGSSMHFLVQDRNSEVYRALVQSGNEQMANQLASYTSAYWGNQRLSAPYYAGAVICFLFVVGMFYADRKYMWWLASASALSIVLTWGDNFAWFNYFMFDYMPGYSKFRSVTFALTIILFAMPLLGLLGLESLLKEGWKKDSLKKLAWPFGITAGLLLVLAISGGFGSFLRPAEEELPAWFTNALRADRTSLLRSDAWRSFWFVVVFSTILFARLKHWVKDPIFVLITALLVTLDLGFVDSRYLTKDSYQRKRPQAAHTAYEADLEILRDNSYYRVFNIQSLVEARTSYFHNSIGGYHGAKLMRYQDLFDSCIYRQTQKLISDLQSGRPEFPEYGVINMLNVRYLTYGPDRNNIIPNPEANGAAWFVSEIATVNSPAEELEKVCVINTYQTAVIDASKMDIPSISFDSAATISITEWKPNYLKYESESNTSGLAVFSEIFYPKGWVATIDGNDVPILRANYVLRALAVPSGKHTIEFRFSPAAYKVGNKITFATSWVLLLVVIGSIGWTLKKDE